MTLPPNYQEALNRARDAYIVSLAYGLGTYPVKRYYQLRDELAKLLDLTTEQAQALINEPNGNK
jgi:hypothetical protein